MTREQPDFERVGEGDRQRPVVKPLKSAKEPPEYTIDSTGKKWIYKYD